MKPSRLSHTLRALFIAALLASACDDNTVQSQDDARRAYLGLDPSIDKALDLGFKGFNEASSANIPQEIMAGGLSGTMTIAGQVDQGSSANKQMRLTMVLGGYSDVAHFVYAAGGGAADGGATPPELDMSLRNIPNGTLSGTLV